MDQPTLAQSIMTGLACRCPRCRKGHLFSGFLNLHTQCEACGLDYSFADAGDGPAIFVILISGFIVVGAALIVEVVYQPPFWVHALLWGPLILIVTSAISLAITVLPVSSRHVRASRTISREELLAESVG